jgi:hypothetical protein
VRTSIVSPSGSTPVTPGSAETNEGWSDVVQRIDLEPSAVLSSCGVPSAITLPF